jgi:hypothetical protein
MNRFIMEHAESDDARTTSRTFVSTSHSLTLLRELRKMRECGSLCDVTLLVGGGLRLHAHRIVLCAASAFFSAMFSSGMKESESGEVDLGNVPSNAVQDLVDFAYSSSLSLSYTSALQLISAADMLQFSEVKQVCCDFLCRYLTHTNCLELLQVADTYSCPELHRAASLCRDLNFPAVSEQEDFLELSLVHLEECLSSNHLCVSGEEEVVVEAALRWLDHDTGSRSRHAPRVLGCVRLSLLPPGVLVERVWPHAIVPGSPECMELVRRALSVQLSPTTNTRPHLEQVLE